MFKSFDMSFKLIELMLSRFRVCEASVVIITELFFTHRYFPIFEVNDSKDNGPEDHSTTEAPINYLIGLGNSVFHLLHKLFLSDDCNLGVSFGFNLGGKIVSIKFAVNSI